MRSEHDHWGELRALRKKLKRADSEARPALWQRYLTLSWLLELLLDAKAEARCQLCGNKLGSGYGLAGGGMGSYTFCTACNFFEKQQDPACSSA